MYKSSKLVYITFHFPDCTDLKHTNMSTTNSASEKAAIRTILLSMGCTDSANCEEFLHACYMRSYHKFPNTLRNLPTQTEDSLARKFATWMTGDDQFAIENCLMEITASKASLTTASEPNIGHTDSSQTVDSSNRSVGQPMGSSKRKGTDPFSCYTRISKQLHRNKNPDRCTYHCQEA
jgi:hypothetical protein